MPPSIPETAEAISGFPKTVRSLSGISDTTNNAIIGNKYANMIWIGTAGNVSLCLEDGNSVVFPALIAGRWHRMPPFKRVNLTGSAVGLVAILGVAHK
jgi:hypothetical protein